MPLKYMNVHLPCSLVARAKALAETTPGLTISALYIEGIEAVVKRLERRNGGAYPPRTGRLKPGRPVGRPDREEATQPQTLNVDEALQERLRDAIFWNPRLRIQDRKSVV
mgnify:CR=1 FL=1